MKLVKIFKPNMKFVALAGLQMIMSPGSSDTPDGETNQQKSFQCEYGDFDQYREQCEIGNGDSRSNLGVMYVNGARD